jgi:predicted NAD/FAD-binding protein
MNDRRDTSPQRIAVVGSGIAGLGAAWALAQRHDVTVFEAESRLGGHANTVDISDGDRAIPVDTGFIVYNAVNYPNLVRLFAALDVPTAPSDMSFAVSIGDGAFEYRGSAAGLLAQPSNVLRPSYRHMVSDILRFNRESRSLLASDSTESVGEFLNREGYSAAFTEDFLLPMVGCIWSSRLDQMLSYPVKTLVRFLDNHGLLQVRNRPSWRTVDGGSREYVRRIAEGFGGRIQLDSPVLQTIRDDGGVTLRTATGPDQRFDQVVFATHADTTLAALGTDATPEERQVLGSFRFQDNEAVLHRDPSLMPKRARAWSSWNYLAEGRTAADRERGVSLTYWMNRLQNLRTDEPVLVTLNPAHEPRDIVASFDYQHPIYDRAAIDAQAAIPSIQGTRRTWFAGAWTGFGFHEDGLRSGLAVATALGAPAPWAGEVPTISADASFPSLAPSQELEVT